MTPSYEIMRVQADSDPSPQRLQRSGWPRIDPNHVRLEGSGEDGLDRLAVGTFVVTAELLPWRQRVKNKLRACCLRSRSSEGKVYVRSSRPLRKSTVKMKPRRKSRPMSPATDVAAESV